MSAVTISEEPDSIITPPLSAEYRPARPSHLLRKSISNKRLHGRASVSPLMTASSSTSSPLPRLNLGQSHTDENTPTTSSPSTALIDQIHDWISAERAKVHERRERRHERRSQRAAASASSADEDAGGNRIPSPLSSTEESLNALEKLLQQASVRGAAPARRSSTPVTRRRSLIPVGAASDTEYASDGEPMVPGCEEWLGTPEELGEGVFKLEVLKLAHTLRCKGWRKVDLERSDEVEISRISGALTNAVYMVSPPTVIPSANNSTTSLPSPKPYYQPSKLLLRIYGPQVGHLIDRSTELSILRRLARNHIGPRLLGTFQNGRFEQFFQAATLTKSDIRQPSTSRHISKRLKELHSGIEITPAERTSGPIAWINIHKWLPQANHIIATLPPSHPPPTNWPLFLSTLGAYEAFLLSHPYELVFAHNDTQYGNILRLDPPAPSTRSPLLLPQNAHRKLIVIDFEYASANPRGFEFANHFSEWMADYHDEVAPHVMNPVRYPSIEAQKNFLRAYVEHRLGGAGGEVDESVVDELLAETRRWRAASHAMWCVWGVVQANVGGGEEEFDYLKYAEDRAALFWGDMVALGLVEEGLLREYDVKVKKIVEA